ncbi:hypothetical protein Aca07nite_67810 [Actinoplanes capillaceus]|uniref:Uncharacterized protein n=2 Tax=Actinoplanes campanulatus TaxID=113559 RepID=A0ABQ3WT87_9ACTN|nr:hypothetical protein Aca07nite_67810 [Actinoplanes capillaceus]
MTSDGTLHRAMSPKPTSARLIDTTGIIRFCAYWADDERGLRTALIGIIAGCSATAVGRYCARSVTCLASSASLAGGARDLDADAETV